MTRKKQSKRGLRVCCLMGCMVLLFSQPFGISAQQTEQGGPGKVSAADSQQFISGKVIEIRLLMWYNLWPEKCRVYRWFKIPVLPVEMFLF